MTLALIVPEMQVTRCFAVKQEAVCPPVGDAVVGPSLLSLPPRKQRLRGWRRPGAWVCPHPTAALRCDNTPA